MRRPRAGSRHVQATLAATLLALALVAWANAEAILSFRGLAQAIGALAVIWGISTAVAAVRGRRAAGTAITATLAALVSIPALVAIAVAPPPVVAQPLLWGCPQYLDRATVTCPTASFHTPIYSSDLDLESTPTIDTGFGHARLVVDTDEPLIVHATLTSGFVNVYQLQGWTVTWSDMDYEISNHMQGFAVNRSGMDVTVKSPDAIDGVTPVVHMTTGIGEVSIEYVGADQ